MKQNFDDLLAALHLPIFALRLSDDWLVPAGSLTWLLGKMSRSPSTVGVLTAQDMDGQPADHFSWMKAPRPIVERVAQWMSARAAVDKPA
jgi:predicted alpha/beta hydrolase